MNSNVPLVSVIITTYNRKNIVGRAIEGVVNQSYPNIELIVVDDCSNDGTEAYFSVNWLDKVKYVRHKENLGVQFASNTGYSHSSGKYLAFIGDDDQWSDPDKLAKQVEIFENDQLCRYGIVTTSVRVVTDTIRYEKIITRPRNLFKHLLSKNGIIYGSAALLRREAFEYAGKFAEELPKGTDSDVFRRIVILGYDVYFIEKPMVDYYETGGDRMTGTNLKACVRSIKGELYKLRMYSEFYSQYRPERSLVLQSLGTLYCQLYIRNRNAHNRMLALSCLRRSFLVYPFNYRALYRFLKFLVSMN